MAEICVQQLARSSAATELPSLELKLNIENVFTYASILSNVATVTKKVQ